MRFPAPILVLTLDSSWSNTIGIGSAQSAPHHSYAVDHSAGNILEQRLVCHSFSRLSHSCHTLSRWPWSAPLHRNNTSLDGPGLHHFIDSRQVIFLLSRWPWSSPLHRNNTSLGPQPLHGLRAVAFMNHFTLRLSLPRGCARFTVRTRRLRVCLHLLLHKTLLPSNQTHSHQVRQFPFPVARQPLRSDVSNV